MAVTCWPIDNASNDAKLIKLAVDSLLGAKVAESSNGLGQSDVTKWGIGAVAFVTLAVLASTLNVILPQSVWVGLHANRLEGGNLNQLRAEVTRLRDEQLVMRRQTTQLRSRLIIAERGRSEVGQRVNALEASIPVLLEVVPPGTEIDRGLFTAAIGDSNDDSVTFEAEGGSVTLVRRPLFEDSPGGAQDLMQALPPALDGSKGPVQDSGAGATQTVASLPQAPGSSPAPQSAPDIKDALEETALGVINATAALEFPAGGEPSLTEAQFGIAIGASISPDEADALWQELSGKLGTLLLGLEPAISDPLNDGGYRIVLGSISDYAQAELLCLRIIRLGIECLPVQFDVSKAVSLR